MLLNLNKRERYEIDIVPHKKLTNMFHIYQTQRALGLLKAISIRVLHKRFDSTHTKKIDIRIYGFRLILIMM